MTDSPILAPEPRPVAAREPWSSEFDQVRATVQALQGAATLLQGALEQRQGLWAEMRGAESSLSTLQQQRSAAEQALAAAQTQLQRTSQELAQVRLEQSGVVAEFDKLVQNAMARRGALVSEIAQLEQRRNALLTDGAPSVATAIVTPQPVVVPQPIVMPQPVVVPQPVVMPQPVVEPMPAPAPVEPTLLVSAPPAEPTPIASVRPEPVPVPMPVAVPAPARPRRSIVMPALRALLTTLFAALLVGLAVLVTPVSQLAGGLQILAIMSGSMEPTLNVGGIVGVRPIAPSELKVGDIITFTNPSSPDVPITHRVVTVEQRGAQTLLTTRGDANDAVDAFTTATSRPVGKVEFTAPYLGYLMVWLSTPLAKIGILVVSLIGFALPSLKLRRGKPAPAESTSAVRSSESYRQLEREIQDLLPRAS